MQKRIKRIVKKRSFLLFELMLAFFLLSCILFPMMKSHFVILRKENERVEKIQLERIKESAFADIRKILSNNEEFTFAALKKGVCGTLSEKATVYKGKNQSKKYAIAYEIKPLESCYRKSIHEHYLLVEVKISFLPPNKKVGYDYFTTFLLREYA